MLYRAARDRRVSSAHPSALGLQGHAVPFLCQAGMCHTARQWQGIDSCAELTSVLRPSLCECSMP